MAKNAPGRDMLISQPVGIKLLAVYTIALLHTVFQQSLFLFFQLECSTFALRCSRKWISMSETQLHCGEV